MKLLLFLLILFYNTGFCANKDKNTSVSCIQKHLCSIDEQKYLQKKKIIKMCVDPDWMPFEHINLQGWYEGILADYIKLFSKKLGIPFVLQKTYSYNQSRQYLKEGKCDIIVGEQATEDVKKEFFATKPYFISPRAFVTHTDALVVHDFSQIAYSGKIGVLQNSPAQVLLPEIYQGIKLITVKNTDKGLQEVASGELVAFVNVLPALIYSIQKQGLGNIKIGGTLPSSVQLSVLINKRHPFLLTILNKVISTTTRQEEQAILSKWVKVRYVKGLDYTLVLQISLLFITILFLIALRYLHIHKLNRKLAELHQKLETKMQNEIEKNRQQQLLILQQNRLVQKGETISMIAHQWRQPLNSLSLLNQTFLMKYKSSQVTEKVIEDFTRSSHRLIHQMSKTIDDFRNFFQKEKEKVLFSVPQIVLHAVSIIKPVLDNENIIIKIDIEKEFFYTGFPNELGQAIINIINNAKDALCAKEKNKKHITIHCIQKKDAVEIKICDNGGGITEEILPQIFDPYFSTKLDKQGTGLGLYMSRIIIEEHMHGKLKVFNQNDGACFVIVLPLVN